MPNTVSGSTALPEDYLHRFGGVARLYGLDALTKLHSAHFLIAGLGGVGSWTAEALARSGVGTLTLIDLDDICQTNTNRQVHALNETIGKQKTDVLTVRLKSINPSIQIHSISDFVTQKNIHTYLSNNIDVVVDAVDSANVKAAFIAHCSKQKIRLIVSGSSGGKRDPQKIVVGDLGTTICDPMLSKVRNILYRHFNFTKSRNRRFRVDAVYSTEQMVYPKPDGSICQEKKALQAGVKLDCAGGFGSATMLTGSFGFAAANKAIERYLSDAEKKEKAAADAR